MPSYPSLLCSYFSSFSVYLSDYQLFVIYLSTEWRTSQEARGLQQAEFHFLTRNDRRPVIGISPLLYLRVWTLYFFAPSPSWLCHDDLWRAAIVNFCEFQRWNRKWEWIEITQRVPWSTCRLSRPPFLVRIYFSTYLLPTLLKIFLANNYRNKW